MRDALRERGRAKLRDAQEARGAAVIEAHGCGPEGDLLAQLLALNLAAAADHGAAGLAAKALRRLHDMPNLHFRALGASA